LVILDPTGLGHSKIRQLSGCGTQTAGLGFGGAPPAPGTSTGATEEYDGSILGQILIL
jgi:hypothetical protein